MTRLEIAAQLLAATPLPAGALAYDRKIAIADALAYADALLAAAESGTTTPPPTPEERHHANTCGICPESPEHRGRCLRGAPAFVRAPDGTCACRACAPAPESVAEKPAAQMPPTISAPEAAQVMREAYLAAARAEGVPTPPREVTFDRKGDAVGSGWGATISADAVALMLRLRPVERGGVLVAQMLAGAGRMPGEEAPPTTPAAPPDPHDFALACLRNSGIDVTCGACVEVAFCGAATQLHTCARSLPAPAAPPPDVAEHLRETVWLVAEAFGAKRDCPGCQAVVRKTDKRNLGYVCLAHGPQARKDVNAPPLPPDTCPDCRRPKATSVIDAATGACPKWWAIRDPEADRDCAKHTPTPPHPVAP